MKPKARQTETANGKTDPQNSFTTTENGKTTPEISLTETGTGKTAVVAGENEGLTASKTGNKGGRPAKPASTTAVTWSVRGVERETRALLEKAAARTNKTMGQYFNDEVRAFVQSQLSQAEAPQLPASPRDLQVQVEQLTQLVEGIASRLAEPARKSLWQRVFGK
jgi:hypothetical protein